MEENKRTKILAVDDEADICEILKFNLEAEGYKVDTVNSSEEALKKKLDVYSLFILDIMMNGMSGLRLADEIRKTKKNFAPIIFLTAKSSENDRLTGFSIGADDYITKPFSVRELIARVKVVLRRTIPEKEVNNLSIKVSGIELDLEKKKLLIEGAKNDLTPIEFHIIQLLLKNQGKIFTRDKILNIVWKENNNVVDRIIDVHIARLRKKLGAYGKYLISRSGYGYCFEME